MFVELPVEKWRRFLSTPNEKVTQLVDYQLVASLLAEREGFEPPAPFSAAVFKTAVIDHSTISPFSSRKNQGSDVSDCKDSSFYRIKGTFHVENHGMWAFLSLDINK